MNIIPEAEYDGGRRGGISAAIKRRPKLLPSYSVGQAIAAVHGDPTVSYNEKSAIWSKDYLYAKYFNSDLTAQHIVFCYSLLRAIELEKASLRGKDTSDLGQLTAADNAKLDFESITDRVIPNRFKLSFGPVSPDAAEAIWTPTVISLSNLQNQLNSAFSDGLKNSERVGEVVKSFSQLVASLKGPYESTFLEVRKNLKIAL